MKSLAQIAGVVCVLFSTASARAEVALPKIFSDGMVLQRGETAPVYGTAADGKKVSVEFRGAKAETTAAGGAWRVDIPPGEPGGPFTLNVKGTNAVTIKNVYVGDVWICSGQSNMHLCSHYKPLPEAPEHIRFFTGTGGYFKDDPEKWRAGGSFSKFGGHSGLAIYEHVKVPLGLIYAAQGATKVNRWLVEKVSVLIRRPNSKRRPDKRMADNDCYRDWIEPLQPYGIKGVIWWQGSTDSLGDVKWGHYAYYQQFPAMINGWRKAWGQGDFPFLWVQLQSMTKREPGGYVRDAMRRALALPNTGMAVAFDLTNDDLIPCWRPGDGHPCNNKQVVPVLAARMALAARYAAYGEKDLVWTGPLYEKTEIKGDKLVVHFTLVADGLVARKGGEKGLYGFDVQEKVPAEYYVGDYGEFKTVAAKISDDKKTVVLDIKGLTPPFRVRYAWGAIPKANLYNTADLPAAPFVTDPIPAR